MRLLHNPSITADTTHGVTNKEKQFITTFVAKAQGRTLPVMLGEHSAGDTLHGCDCAISVVDGSNRGYLLPHGDFLLQVDLRCTMHLIRCLQSSMRYSKRRIY